jgi:hypothetical protein
MDFIERKATNPLKEKSARVSANSLLSGLVHSFGAETIAGVRDCVEIPSPIPFAEAKVEKVRVPRYRSGFDMGGAPAQRAPGTGNGEA